MSQTVMQQAPLRIVVESVPPLLVLALQGELDAACAGLVRSIDLINLSQGVSSIIVDLSRLTYCDTTGMRALLDLRADHETPDRRVRIVNTCPPILRLAALMGEERSLSA